MIVGLSIALLATLVALWITLMILWWKKETAVSEPLAAEITLVFMEKCARLLRRGWYACRMHLVAAWLWMNKNAAKLFVRLFPSAAPAFAKKDELTGLQSGPSSFFLMTISEREKQKSAPQRKIV